MKIIAITPNQKNDFLASAVIEGLKKLNIEIIATDGGNGIIKTYSDDEIIEHSQDADYILAIWGKFTQTRAAKYYLLDKIDKPEKTVYIDGSEWTFTGHPNPKPGQIEEALNNPSRRRGKPWIWNEMRQRVRWYFKRECYPQDIEEFGCIPFPFAGFDNYHKDVEEKTIDLYCGFGHNSTGIRAYVQKIINQLRNRGRFLVQQYPYEQYLITMAMSWCVADAWGGGDCNARFFEGLANKACMLYQKWNIIMPYPFIDGKNIIEYSTTNELIEKIEYYFPNNLDKVKEMSKKSYEHYLKYHTTKARVEYMLDILNNQQLGDKH